MKAAGSVAGICLVLLALTWLILHGCNAESQSTQQSLRALDRLSASGMELHRDVLRARAGMLRNYDPLVAEVDEVRAAFDNLRKLSTAPEESAVADRIATLMDRQEDLVEQFKSQNALLQNSLAYFGLFTARLGSSGQDPEVVRAVSRLATAMLLLTLDTSAALAKLEDELDALGDREFPPSVADDLRALGSHASLLKALVPAADDTLRSLNDLPYDETAGALRNLVEARRASAELVSARSRSLLYAISVVLAAMTMYLARGLQVRALALRRRAALEHVIARNSTKLINSRTAETLLLVEQTLAELTECLGADRGYLILSHKAGLEVHRWCRPGQRLPPDWPETAMALASSIPETTGPVVCVEGNRRSGKWSPGVRLLSENSLEGWICVPGAHGERVSGILGFDFLERPPAGQASEVGSLRMAFNAMANALHRDQLEEERARLEKNLQHTRRIETVGALASGVAHNFNNILGAILGFTELAHIGVGSNMRVSRHLEEIRRAAERARDLSNQILTLGRRGDMQRRAVSVSGLVDETKLLLDASLAPGASIVVRDQSDSATVSGDAVQLQQVVMNLCTNAAQAMEDEGDVTIEVATRSIDCDLQLTKGDIAAGKYVVLSVIDTGRGMDKEGIQRAFEPFFTTRRAGNGLGLATAREIILEHGGAIDVHSVPGRGTRVDVWLPREEELASHTERRSIFGAGETVLVIESDRARLEKSEELVAALGYEPVGFVDAGAAIAACRGNPARFDAVLICQTSTPAALMQYARDLRQFAPGLPILLTMHDSEVLEAESLAGAGVTEVLSRPLMSGDLAEALNRCLRLSRKELGSTSLVDQLGRNASSTAPSRVA